MRFRYLFPFFLMLANFAFAGNLIVDSLKQELSRVNLSDTQRIDLEMDISRAYFAILPDSIYPHASSAYKLAFAIDDNVRKGKSLAFLSIYYFTKADYHTAIDTAQSALIVYETETDTSVKAVLFNLIGSAYHALGYYELSLENHLKALKWRELLNSKLEIANSCNNIALIYQSQGDFKEAMKFLDKGIELAAQEEAAALQYALLLTNRASVLNEMGNYFEARESALRGLELKQKLGYVLGVFHSKIILGSIAMKLGEFEASHSYLKEAIKVADDFKALDGLSEAYYTMGALFFEVSELDSAIFYYDLALKLSQKIKVRNRESEVLESMSELYEKQGNSDLAFTYFRMAIVVKDSIGGKEIQNRIEELMISFDTESKVAENVLLKERERSNRAEIRRQSQLNIFITFFILVLILVAFLLFRSNKRYKRIGETIEKQRFKLEELNNEKDSLLSIVAHDLKSPLDKIKGLSHLIGLQGPLNEEQQYSLGIMGKVADNGTNLIRDLLDITMAEKIGYEMNLKEVDLNQFTDRFLVTMEAKAAEKEIEVEFCPIQTNLSVFGDEEYLMRILENLVSNAFKFSPPNRKVIISTGLVQEYGWVSVKDNGPGISGEDQKKMFRKFQKLTARPTGGESSTGLGLSIIKTLVEKMHGSIAVESELGNGADFVFRLPLS